MDDGKPTYDTDCFDGPFTSQNVDTCFGDYCASYHGWGISEGHKIGKYKARNL